VGVAAGFTVTANVPDVLHPEALMQLTVTLCVPDVFHVTVMAGVCWPSVINPPGETAHK
jgi:hypothetical protein